MATVRNRRGLITAVEPYDAPPEGRLHLVTVEYTDPDGVAEDRLIWEREPGATVVPPTALPDLHGTAAMQPDEFDALVRATRWTALSPFIDPDGGRGPLTRSPIASPLHGAIQPDDFQFVPLLKALRMPRIALLLADDVGLGKTIEAGLILTELLLRRRIRRVLVLCPAALTRQWKDEMAEKFSLGFDIVDRRETQALRRRLGLDANPWRIYGRVITSYDYLKQADILEQFRSASIVEPDSPRLPWDLLILDEAHNLAPAPVGEESDLSRMLGHLAPLFEHRLFLTATPHNGHTRSFSGLLERLDPVRFSRTSDLSDAERKRIEDVKVRRLKSEINARTNPPRFPERIPKEVRLVLGPEEKALAEAFAGFRRRVRGLVAQRGRGEQMAGAFAVEILGKRLLSCPAAFADSWQRYWAGATAAQQAELDDVRAAERAAREDLDDDLEREGRAAHAARTVGAWLKPLSQGLQAETEAVNRALVGLGFEPREGVALNTDPVEDSRFIALVHLIDNNLRASSRWRDDERLIVFTEYKGTMDYLVRRLRTRYPDDAEARILTLYGGMDEDDRHQVRTAFNDSGDAVRVLVATDAASEGLNLQETARYLLHFDIPWNPARLEQRNGRLDRHGQARDVVVHHFGTDDDADLNFLAHVVEKVNTIREELGSMGEVFEAAIEQRFVESRDAAETRLRLDQAILSLKGRTVTPRDSRVTSQDEDGIDESIRQKALMAELDLDPESLGQTLDIALGLQGPGRPRLEGPDDRGRFRLRMPIPPDWEVLIDDSLRLREDHGGRGALPAIVFDPAHFIEMHGGRPIFRNRRDTSLLHLGHPLFHRVMTTFARARFPGSGGGPGAASRWTVRRGVVPAGADALLLLTIEELAVNELRETFHHWVRTLRFPVQNGRLGSRLPLVPALELRGSMESPDRKEIARARELWEEIQSDIRRILPEWADGLSSRLQKMLEQDLKRARETELARFQSRQGELSALITQQSVNELMRELTELQVRRRQMALFEEEEERLAKIARSETDLRAELERRQQHLEEMREQLERERHRVLNLILPRRYALRDRPQVFPVAVEVRLPGRGAS